MCEADFLTGRGINDAYAHFGQTIRTLLLPAVDIIAAVLL